MQLRPVDGDLGGHVFVRHLVFEAMVMRARVYKAESTNKRRRREREREIAAAVRRQSLYAYKYSMKTANRFQRLTAS